MSLSSHFVSKKVRKAIYERDNYTCVFCGKKVEKGKNATLDHIVARAYYRDNGQKVDHSPKNLVTCCKWCNDRKKDDDIMTFVNRYLPHLSVYKILDAIDRQTRQQLELA